MPSNWLYVDTNFPTFTGQESTNDKINTIQNYLFMLVEQLRYTLRNLDTANVNLAALEEYSKGLTDPIYIQIGDLNGRADGIIGRMEDDEGNISILQQTATAITAMVANAQGDISVLQQTASSLTAQVKNAQGDISILRQTATDITSRVEQVRTDLDGKIRANTSEIRQTATDITSRVTSVETDLAGRITANTSSIEQTATAITSRVEEVKTDLDGKIKANTSEIRQTAKDITATITSTQGDVSVLQQTAASLTARVSGAEGGISSLTQTATALTTRVSNAEKSVSTLQQTATTLSTEIKNAKGDLSTLTQKVDGFKLEVTNGETTSTIALKSGSTSISSQKIELTGFVTFKGLSGGTTTIDGACIKTGTVAAKYIDADVIRTGNLKDGTTIISGDNIKTGTISAERIDAKLVRSTDLSGGSTTISGACIKTGAIKADYIDVDNLKVKSVFDKSGNRVIDATTAGQIHIGSVSGITVGTMTILATDVTIGAGSTNSIKVSGPSIVPQANGYTVATLGDTNHCWGGGYFKALHTNSSGLTILGSGEKLGFFGSSPSAKKTVSTSGSVESVVSSLVTALKAYGLI